MDESGQEATNAAHIGYGHAPSAASGSLVAQWLIELIGELTAEAGSPQEELPESRSESLLEGSPETVHVLRETVLGLIRQRLGQSNGITTATRRLLHQARVHGFMRRPPIFTRS